MDWRLPLALVLAESTGQRAGAILQLQRSDLDLSRLPYGWIGFRAEVQKTEYEHYMALPEYVRPIVQEHLRRLGSRSAPWLFPAERKPEKPVLVSVLSKKLRAAYDLAGLETPDGSLWHAWRRKWATERKGMPRVDVAKAGGWKDVATLESCYQQADEATQLQVFLEAPKLCSQGVQFSEVPPNATPAGGEHDRGERSQRQAG